MENKGVKTQFYLSIDNDDDTKQIFLFRLVSSSKFSNSYSEEMDFSDRDAEEDSDF